MTAYEPATLTALAEDAAAPAPTETNTATFGMGCFWGPDARFGAMEGVVRTRVGYAGGSKSDPTYYALGEHTEVVQVEYDPAVLAYEDLLDVFWANHTWTHQGKRQYRGVVLAHDETQRHEAERSRDALETRTGQPVATPIEMLSQFWLAEQSHQKYELRTLPVVADELEARYGDKMVDSTVAARLNGFVAGHGTETQRTELLAALDLPPAALSEVRRRC